MCGRSGDAAMTGERVGPGAHPAAPGPIPAPAGRWSRHRRPCAVPLRFLSYEAVRACHRHAPHASPKPAPHKTRSCRRTPPRRNRSARTAKEKARSRRATRSFAVNDVAAAASSGDRHR